jgi:hypothetical protein
MNSDLASLNNLNEIVLPSAPPFWPPAAGFWLLVIILAGLLGLVTTCYFLNRKKNAYRRAGLMLLAEAGTIREIDIVLKRVGLAAFKREIIAPLYGKEWASFLDSTCAACHFVKLLAKGEHTPIKQYSNCASTWIKHHKRVKTC